MAGPSDHPATEGRSSAATATLAQDGPRLGRDAWIVNALTDGGRGGNPAAVVLDADGLAAEERLAIAGRVGLSETAFVSASRVATMRLEFFTPTRQIAHSGHATVAAFALLRSLGRVPDGTLSKETIDGVRTVQVDGGQVFMEQRAPRYEQVDAGAALGRAIAASVGVAPRAVDIVDTGNRFAIIDVGDRDSLAAIRPDLPAIGRLSDDHDLIGYYLFSRAGAREGRVATTRMFAPRYGIAEEAATGMAAGPLACLLHDRFGLGPRLTIEQGAWMPTPSPSAIEVRLDVVDGKIARLYAGGRATTDRRVAVA